MKYIMFLFAIVLSVATTTHAQSVTTMALVAGDTCTNTDTVDKYLPQFSGGYSGICIAPFVNKVSGTVAGKVYLYESELSSGAWGSPIDSLTLSNTSVNTKVFKLQAPCSNFYRLQFTSSGTTVYQVRVRYAPKIFQITP